MAEQLQALTLAQQDLQRRLRLVLIISIVAAVLAVGAMIVAVNSALIPEYPLGLRPSPFILTTTRTQTLRVHASCNWSITAMLRQI
jgi:hypothetical protein